MTLTIHSPEITPTPFMSESAIQERLHKYASDPVDHITVEHRTKMIKKILAEDLDNIARELALFERAFVSFDPTLDVVRLHNPSVFAFVN